MRKITAFVIVAVFSIFFLQPKTANAVTLTSFSFTGTCTLDCTGTVTATLVLQNYTIGNSLNAGNFDSFMYHSNIFPDVTVNSVSFLSGGFNSLPGTAVVNLISNAPQFQFISGFGSPGGWCAGISCSGDFGVNGPWSVTPLPAALPFFASGLAGLGLL